MSRRGKAGVMVLHRPRGRLAVLLSVRSALCGRGLILQIPADHCFSAAHREPERTPPPRYHRAAGQPLVEGATLRSPSTLYPRVSIISLKRRRSSSSIRSGSCPSIDATSEPNFPAGGAYWSVTITSVPGPSPARWNRTEPAFSTSDPLRERHPINSFSTSLMISASHSTFGPPIGSGFTVQCDRRSLRASTDSRWLMIRGKFSRFRQNRYSSSGLRSTETRFSIFTACPVGTFRRPSRFVSAPSASYSMQYPLTPRWSSAAPTRLTIPPMREGRATPTASKPTPVRADTARSTSPTFCSARSSVHPRSCLFVRYRSRPVDDPICPSSYLVQFSSLDLPPGSFLRLYWPSVPGLHRSIRRRIEGTRTTRVVVEHCLMILFCRWPAQEIIRGREDRERVDIGDEGLPVFTSTRHAIRPAQRTVQSPGYRRPVPCARERA